MSRFPTLISVFLSRFPMHFATFLWNKKLLISINVLLQCKRTFKRTFFATFISKSSLSIQAFLMRMVISRQKKTRKILVFFAYSETNTIIRCSTPHENGGAGEIWTPAPVSQSIPLAGAPLKPLEYYSVT